MKKLYGLKRTISCAAATVFTIGIAGSSMNYTPASANSDSEYFYEGSDQTAVIDSTADKASCVRNIEVNFISCFRLSVTVIRYLIFIEMLSGKGKESVIQ